VTALRDNTVADRTCDYRGRLRDHGCTRLDERHDE